MENSITSFILFLGEKLTQEWISGDFTNTDSLLVARGGSVKGDVLSDILNSNRKCSSKNKIPPQNDVKHPSPLFGPAQEKKRKTT